MENETLKNIAEKAYNSNADTKVAKVAKVINDRLRPGHEAPIDFAGAPMIEKRVKIPQPPTVFDWRYGEGEILRDLEDHIKKTYSSHYTSENLEKIQTIDVFAHRGTLGSTSIDNAIKYLMRYGKKDGKNEKDLIKALHYLILATAFERKNKPRESVDITV